MSTKILNLLRRRRASTPPPWTPASVVTLALWLEASPTYCFQDAGGLTACGDGDAVALWKDRSGAGRDFSQIEPTFRPLLKLVAGRWAVLFDGSNDNLTRVGLGTTFPTAGTLGVRFQTTNDTHDYDYLMTANAGGSFALYVPTGQSYPCQFRSVRIDAQPGIVAGKHTALTRSSASTWTRRLDGVQDVVGAAGHSGGDDWFVGAADGANRPISGYVAGVAAYPSYLSDADATALETYLGGLF